jgi:hypothetical protein
MSWSCGLKPYVLVVVEKTPSINRKETRFISHFSCHDLHGLLWALVQAKEITCILPHIACDLHTVQEKQSLRYTMDINVIVRLALSACLPCNSPGQNQPSMSASTSTFCCIFTVSKCMRVPNGRTNQCRGSLQRWRMSLDYPVASLIYKSDPSRSARERTAI